MVMSIGAALVSVIVLGLGIAEALYYISYPNRDRFPKEYVSWIYFRINSNFK